MPNADADRGPAAPRPPAPPPAGTLTRLRRWFWRPPRAHGEVIEDRTVSYLELFYDLVYVVVISQAAHPLATHASPRAVLDFAIVFGLIWIAWANGSLYLELHGREDGRTRAFTFLQMAVLAQLATFTADAAGASGPAFARVYAIFLAVMTWLWYTVRRQDGPEYMAATGAYLVGMLLSIGAMAASAGLPAGPRLAIWALVDVGWILGMQAMGRRRDEQFAAGVRATDSLVERFGLLTIIVLGEGVVGVVNGLNAAPHDATSILTGLTALGVGFGLWWIYFDVVGRRLPRQAGGPLTSWMTSHLPVTMAIAATGAGLAGLIAQAHVPRTPGPLAGLLAGAVALALVGLTWTARTLADFELLGAVFRPTTRAMLAGAGAALFIGWLRPAPWLLALGLTGVLAAIWLLAVLRYVQVDAWARDPRARDGAGEPP
ncbi:MAG: low temperature requirement protein A [Caldilineae bacterium]|nr:low temperature requirement protein A [Caldilineae bacterium]